MIEGGSGLRAPEMDQDSMVWRIVAASARHSRMRRFFEVVNLRIR